MIPQATQRLSATLTCSCQVSSRGHQHKHNPHSGASPLQPPAVLRFDPLHSRRVQCSAAAGMSSGAGSRGGGDNNSGSSGSGSSSGADKNRKYSSSGMDPSSLPENFCLIESRETVKDFSSMQLAEINESIAARRNRIFLLMEEVRRLRIQQRLKGEVHTKEEDVQVEPYPSVLPFLPPLTDKTVQDYYRFYALAVSFTLLFGGLLAPMAEVRLGIGGTSYADFIGRMHLPAQLAAVDPIVASFCGGAVGVLSALFVVEVNNAKEQARRRCFYCEGTGYLTCGNCVGAGALVTSSGSGADACSFCSGTGKVMCTACLCTGKAMVTEHDPRMDPFN